MFCHSKGSWGDSSVRRGSVVLLEWGLFQGKTCPAAETAPIRQCSAISSFREETDMASGESLVSWPNVECHLWSILPSELPAGQPRLLIVRLAFQFNFSPGPILLPFLPSKSWSLGDSNKHPAHWTPSGTLFTFSYTQWYMKCISQPPLYWCWVTNNPPNLSKHLFLAHQSADQSASAGTVISWSWLQATALFQVESTGLSF